MLTFENRALVVQAGNLRFTYCNLAKAHRTRMRMKLQVLPPFQGYTALKSEVVCTLIVTNTLYYSTNCTVIKTYYISQFIYIQASVLEI